MSSKLTQAAYEQLIAGDRAWLAKQPATLERAHIDSILARAVEYEYALESRLAEAEAAIAEIHRTTGRGDGHGSVTATTACIIDAVVSARFDRDEERKEEEADAALRIEEIARAHADATQAEGTALALAARAAQLEGLLRLRPEVLAFAWAMEARLRANDHKGGWTACEPPWLMERLREEVAELDAAPDMDALNEAADVANFAMMIADTLGRLNTLPARAALERPGCECERTYPDVPFHAYGCPPGSGKGGADVREALAEFWCRAHVDGRDGKQAKTPLDKWSEVDAFLSSLAQTPEAAAGEAELAAAFLFVLHDETQGDGLHGDPDQEALLAEAALDLARRYLGGSR